MVYYFLNWQSAKCMVSVSIAKDGLILALLVQAKNLYGLGPRSIGGTAIAWRCQCLKNQSIFSDLKLTVVMNIKTDSIKLLPKFCRSFLSVGKRHWFPNKKHYLNLMTPHLSTLLHYVLDHRPWWVYAVVVHKQRMCCNAWTWCIWPYTQIWCVFSKKKDEHCLRGVFFEQVHAIS